VSGAWGSLPIYRDLLLVLLALRLIVVAVGRLSDDPPRVSRPFVGLVVVGLVAFIACVVARWLTLPPAEVR